MTTTLSACALLLGGLISFFNWYSIYASRKSGKSVSSVPLIGAIFLVLGFLGYRQTRSYAWLGVIIDYGTLSLIYVLPRLICEAWKTSSVNLLHRFTVENDGRYTDIRLFRNSVFTIRCVHKPAVPCNDYGALVQSYHFIGKWHQQGDFFHLDGYGNGRVLEIQKAGEHFATTEQNYPTNKKFPYDKLHGLELTMIK